MLYKKSKKTQKIIKEIKAIFGNVDGCSDAKITGSLGGQIGSGSCQTVREEGGTSHGRGGGGQLLHCGVASRDQAQGKRWLYFPTR